MGLGAALLESNKQYLRIGILLLLLITYQIKKKAKPWTKSQNGQIKEITYLFLGRDLNVIMFNDYEKKILKDKKLQKEYLNVKTNFWCEDLLELG